MRILVFGKTGQLGLSLRDTQPENLEVEYIGRAECVLTDMVQVRATLDAFNPTIVINAAAYTAVDKAEEEPELARAINAEAPRVMAEWIARRSTDSFAPKFIHISTDFVFDGRKKSPYKTGDPANPLGSYGRSKRDGELAILEAAPDHSIIIRTAWVYSEHGGNFVKTMLRLMNEKNKLDIVDDQTGAPTYARGLAQVLWDICLDSTCAPGVYHWTDSGTTTWCGFARSIQLKAIEKGMLSKEIPLEPLTTRDYPTPATRPAYSVLDTSTLSGLYPDRVLNWEAQLSGMLGRLDNG